MRFVVNSKAWMTFVLVLIIGVTIGFFAYTPRENGADSGIKGCQGIAANAASPKASGSKKTTPMTEEDYRKNRKIYEDSKYADLKAAGTSVIDTVYDMSQDTGQDYSGSMADLYTLRDHWASLKRACANHGVTIPSL
jgi:hypothetical protein